mgnify:CR=1 FL=1
MFYELASSSWGAEEKNAMQRVIDSGMFTMSKNVAEFEKRFAEKFEAKHAVMVSSGSAANLVSLAALFHKGEKPLQRGDEVIVPAISWSTTYYPLQQYGMKLKFIDVEKDTLNIDTSMLEKALTKRTRMVVAVSILGNPCALDSIREFCDAHDLYMFEDNCESMGATLNGKYTGTYGDLGTHSCFFSHHISTMEGGVIVTDDTEISDLCRSLRAHGWTRGLPEESKIFERREDDFEEAYRFIVPGFNARPLELSGAIGIEQLKKLDGMIEIRRSNADIFRKLFENDDRFIIQRENGKSSWFAFTLIVRPDLSISRASVFKVLKENGIGYRMITGGNFLRHDVIKYFDYECIGDMQHANLAHDHGFFVGNHPRDLSVELAKLHEVLTCFLK